MLGEGERCDGGNADADDNGMVCADDNLIKGQTVLLYR